MIFLGVRLAHNIVKILVFSLLILTWSNRACAFNPKPSWELNRNPHIQKNETTCANSGNQNCIPILPIIPGLIGAGVNTPAGSGPKRVGGMIIHVTNLNDSGPGSLRKAVQTRGPRIVVFDVSGYIELQTRIFITEPFLTIAGQTAPFPGVSLKGAGFQIETHDVLVQHIRVRVGDDPKGPKPENRDGFTIKSSNPIGTSYNVVIDHVSVSWAVDENMSTWKYNVHDVTVTNSIISEGLMHSIHPKGKHSMGFLVGPGTKNLFVAGNLFAHNNKRNMEVHGGTSTLFVNNLVYNWRGPKGTASHYGSSQGRLEASVVGNVYIRGLDQVAGPEPILFRTAIMEGSKIFVEDNESIAKSYDPWTSVLGQDEIDIQPFKAAEPPNWIPNLIAKKSLEVKNSVLNNAGARRADNDPVDQRIIRDVQNGTGRLINSQNDVGGWPPLIRNVRGKGRVPKLDIPANPTEIQASGYTRMEEWLHRLARQVETAE